ncbi:MAG: 4-hydroxy-3-methylbut-2-enyl diphosphate reductase [Chloroflexi bacterium]|nr:4-hydroxy-3-methylbut-2-enyl diphosphate reductase [Chloroflexota bacterium]
MQVKLARHMGFCPGVRRALKLIEAEARKRGSIYTLGAIIHNPQEVERLRALGVEPVEDLPGEPGAPLAITAHGVNPSVMREACDRGLEVVDITCPLVAKVQQLAKSLAGQGYFVIIFGDAAHPEVKGILGWAGENAVAVKTMEELLQAVPVLASSRKFKRLATVSQTTQSVQWYSHFTQDLLGLLPRFDEIAVHNTICLPTRQRQESVQDLASEVDVLVVIGGRDSANTRHLVQLAAESGTPAHQVESAGDLRPEWFAGKTVAGVTAGASTPDWVVEEVVSTLREM